MASDAELLRMYLGEVIPNGGSDEDTMFNDSEISTFLESSGSLNEAAALGWKIKAANLSTLVDMAEGSSRRSLRQRWENAMAMTEYYQSLTGPVSSGGTRIRDIERL